MSEEPKERARVVVVSHPLVSTTTKIESRGSNLGALTSCADDGIHYRDNGHNLTIEINATDKTEATPVIQDLAISEG
jgi:hypothetical protein